MVLGENVLKSILVFAESTRNAGVRQVLSRFIGLCNAAPLSVPHHLSSEVFANNYLDM
jgi:hypothetical protein